MRCHEIFLLIKAPRARGTKATSADGSSVIDVADYQNCTTANQLLL